MTKKILDSLEEIKKLDKLNMLGSVEALADQVRHAWTEVSKVQFNSVAQISNVVVAGMGGSALGADVIKYLYKEKTAVPFDIVNSYDLPQYVNNQTLVILSSYSGSTEEVLSCAQQAKEKKCQVMVICAGGDLEKIAKENNYPNYVIEPKFNPSNQPRMALGYSIIGTLGLLKAAGVIELNQEEIEDVLSTIISVNEKCQVDLKQEQNQAKILAFSCLERRPVFVACEFLQGAVHIGANQCNENAKIFADYKIVPEINHHLLEGLKFPSTNPYNHFFVFFNSGLYVKQNQKRMTLTKAIAEKNDIEALEIQLESDSKLTQIFEVITLLSYTSFYLAILENIDPSPIPYVDWFKQELKK